MTISWFASFSESNTFVNFSQSVNVTIIDRAAYCPKKDANQLIVIKHPDTTSLFNSWSAERNGEKINVTVITTIREEL
jgi:hypothetical protein